MGKGCKHVELLPSSVKFQSGWGRNNLVILRMNYFKKYFILFVHSRFLNYLHKRFKMPFSQIHLVGHSLGAQISSFVSRHINGTIGRLTGEWHNLVNLLPQWNLWYIVLALDPASPCFAYSEEDMRVDPSDADFVDVIHTSGRDDILGLGLQKPVGKHLCWYNLFLIITNIYTLIYICIQVMSIFTPMVDKSNQVVLPRQATHFWNGFSFLYIVTFKSNFLDIFNSKTLQSSLGGHHMQPRNRLRLLHWITYSDKMQILGAQMGPWIN